MSTGPSTVIETFQAFYDGWLVRHQNLHERLLLSVTPDSADNEEKQTDLINQVVSHYQQYYHERLRAAAQDVFLVFSAPWLSSFERTLLWISGFKPSMIFKLIDSSIHDLTSNQAMRMRELKAEAKWKEREMANAMAAVQEGVAGPHMLSLARRAGRQLVDGEISELESALEELKAAMLDLLEDADMLRGIDSNESCGDSGSAADS